MTGTTETTETTCRQHNYRAIAMLLECLTASYVAVLVRAHVLHQHPGRLHVVGALIFLFVLSIVCPSQVSKRSLRYWYLVLVSDLCCSSPCTQHLLVTQSACR